MKTDELKKLLKTVIELIAPDLDKYRKPLRKGRVVATYDADGIYYCDVEILLNNDQPDEHEPMVRMVEIPVFWGGENRGIICPPAVGTYCDIDYYHGDPNYPRVSNFRWEGNGAPSAAVDELIIQQTDGVFIRIKANSDVEVKTPAKVIVTAGADAEITIGGSANIMVTGKTTLTSNIIDLDGASGAGATGLVVTTECVCPITGAPHIQGSQTVKASK
jgi:hypothetical protein